MSILKMNNRELWQNRRSIRKVKDLGIPQFLIDKKIPVYDAVSFASKPDRVVDLNVSIYIDCYNHYIDLKKSEAHITQNSLEPHYVYKNVQLGASKILWNKFGGKVSIRINVH